ncbi:MAG: amidohydrolase family protein [Acidobacteria bacterium]|nr:amidohydrolase family protein [Acidobacteriota bacterium]
MPRAFSVLVAAVVLGSVLVAQQGPPAQGQGPGGPGGRGGRGRGIAIQPGEECPPGATLVRVGTCLAPEFPPPSIVDYRPRSTLVVEQHPVPRAKFPAVDIHSHTGPTPQTIDRLIEEMDALNIRVLNNLSGGFGDQLKQRMDFIRSTPHANRFTLFANGLDRFQDVAPGYGRKAAAQLEADVRNGAVGLKIFKETGMDTKKADGTRLKIDDPELAPIWETAARLNIPVIIHTGEPSEFFQQPDMHNERWLELALFADRRRYLVPVAFEELNAERDDLFRQHPNTRFISAHFGWHANDLGRAARLLDAHPNVVLELAAILYDLGRQPRAARDFFLKYQDRILFGKDTYAPAEFPYYWRVLETKDEYFDYYRDYHAFWKLYGMDLPDDVLRKVYYRNALRVTPGLPQTGWPR